MGACTMKMQKGFFVFGKGENVIITKKITLFLSIVVIARNFFS